MGFGFFVNQVWRKKNSETMHYLLKLRAWEYRKLPSVFRIRKPSRPEKARRLGYRSIEGFCVYRIRVRRGDFKRDYKKGNATGKPKSHGINKVKLKKSKKIIAEERVGKICGNLRVLNSYWINQDIKFKYFEIILVDPNNRNIRKSWKIQWICSSKFKHRESRGLTRSGKKSRGIIKKGHGTNKNRPSRKKKWKANNSVKLLRYR
mmetsp:Transcript_14111/g.32563  ORF Transcript_14111/g.32563 Transcript_14111/m.32563 type:complete len:205 (+) Transcript_14111:685-1299(+)